MAKQTVEAMIEGGKASAAPPLGPALGPTGLNVAEVVAKINEKTASFKSMQVPIKIHFDTQTKEFEIEIGTPPTSSLLVKEAGVEKGSGMSNKDKVADLKIEQIIKVAKMKEDALNGATLKEKVKNVIGTCNSMGILVEGKEPREVTVEINNGVYDTEISQQKTELTEEEKLSLEEEKKKLKEEAEKRHADEDKKAQEIITANEGKDKTLIRSKLREAGISESLITKLTAGLAGPGKKTEAKKEEKPKK